MKKVVGVLCHGRHLQTVGWEEIMWGKPPNLLGQLPKMVLVALEEDAKIVLLGAGASEIGGKKEAIFTKDYLFSRFSELSLFSAFKGVDLGVAEKKLSKILVTDIRPQNTAEEMIYAGPLFESAGVEKICIVSSPTHLPRCLNEALKFFSRPGSKFAPHDFVACPSDVGWSSNEDVYIFEPPHRPDDQTGEVRTRIAKMLSSPEKLLEIKKALGI